MTSSDIVAKILFNEKGEVLQSRFPTQKSLKSILSFATMEEINQITAKLNLSGNSKVEKERKIFNEIWEENQSQNSFSDEENEENKTESDESNRSTSTGSGNTLGQSDFKGEDGIDLESLMNEMSGGGGGQSEGQGDGDGEGQGDGDGEGQGDGDGEDGNGEGQGEGDGEYGDEDGDGEGKEKEKEPKTAKEETPEEEEERKKEEEKNQEMLDNLNLIPLIIDLNLLKQNEDVVVNLDNNGIKINVKNSYYEHEAVYERDFSYFNEKVTPFHQYVNELNSVYYQFATKYNAEIMKRYQNKK